MYVSFARMIRQGCNSLACDITAAGCLPPRASLVRFVLWSQVKASYVLIVGLLVLLLSVVAAIATSCVWVQCTMVLQLANLLRLCLDFLYPSLYGGG